jgi:hypothetical protein
MVFAGIRETPAEADEAVKFPFGLAPVEPELRAWLAERVARRAD